MDAIAGHSPSKLRAAAGRYREARRTLHAPASAQSRRGLDWMNFFIADVQTGFGAFVAFYLAQLGWSPAYIGLALSVGGVAGMISQIPGGALADAVTWKRGLAAAGIIMTGVAALILAFAPDWCRCSSRKCCRARLPASLRLRSARSVSVWSDEAQCRCAPDGIFVIPPSATL